jgi:spermidine/putrescine ABC transporter ATP-binding subunit
MPNDKEKDWCCTQVANLQLRALSKCYGITRVVNNVSLTIEKGEFITLLGPSGSGKTTTLMMIAGFVPPTTGDILIDDESIVSKPVNKRNIGVVFQNYSLFPHMVVFENVAFPLRMRKISSSGIQERVKNALDLVKLSGFDRRLPKQLSGGQQQRVALARALVFNPPILLMDEPLGALDKNLREVMQLEIKEIQKKLKITTIYVTHDQSEALTMSDRIVVMNEGGIEQIGSPEELYERPANRFVAGFIGESNFLLGRVATLSENVMEIISEEEVRFKTRTEQRFSIDDVVCVVLRPEKVAFAHESETLEGWNCVDGIIEEDIYLGEIHRYKVRISPGQVLSLKISNKWERERHRKGDHVRLKWEWSDSGVV